MSALSRGHAPRMREKVWRDLADGDVLANVGADQIAYYKARAPWYDDVYECAGEYDRGRELNDEWIADLTMIGRALSMAPIHGDCVELGAGTGYWTEQFIGRVDRLWALDAVGEVLEVARERLGPQARK